MGMPDQINIQRWHHHAPVRGPVGGPEDPEEIGISGDGASHNFVCIRAAMPRVAGHFERE